jgi:hypothetical protein
MKAAFLWFVFSFFIISAPGVWGNILITGDTNPTDLANAVTAGGGEGLTVIGSALSANTLAISNGTAFSSGTYTLSGPLPDTYGLIQGGIVLSSGNVTDYQTGPNTVGGMTTGYGVLETAAQKVLLDPITGVFSHFDVTQLDIVFNADANTTNVFFRVVFGSEEYPEFVNSTFIDGFGLYLNGVNIAFSAGNPVNINHPCMAAVPGTELDGVLTDCGGSNNVVLLFSGPVVPGSVSNKLTFIVADSSDDALDTTVYISSLGGTPPPVVVLSLTPQVATNQVGQQHTVTSCVTSNGVPLANATINIDVTGANTPSGTCVSDTSGCCTFSYTGVNAGDDTITATAVIASGVTNTATATKHWEASQSNGSLEFWKNNPSAWPVSSLTLGGQTYTKTELLKILSTVVGTGTRADASLTLADQLIAAKLNIANGSDPAPVASTIADADALLSGFSGKLPYKVCSLCTTGQAMVSDAGVLNTYNNGGLTLNSIP